MIIIDDLLLRCLGFSLKPFDMIWLMELIRDFSLKERYNIKAINNKIKENRLLFELGETTEKKFKEKHELLLNELETAKEILENLSTDVKIQEMSVGGVNNG